VSKLQAESPAAPPSHNPAIRERRMVSQTDFRITVAAETERPQLAADHGIEHGTADIVVVQLAKALHRRSGAAADRPRSRND
jgi:hypothetical protein